MNLIDKVQQVWPASQWRDTTVVVAISGGADSVALLRTLDLLARLHPGRGQLIAAHFNHRLRGAESDEDEVFVAELCRGLHIPLTTNRRAATSGEKLRNESAAFAPADPETWDGEDDARQVRYAFLRQVVSESGARYLATAHHADDQVETVMHRIIRGTGIQGLAGIPFTRALMPGVSLIRPLLGIWRSEIVAFLGELRQESRCDASNASPRFTRNRVRHELLPLLEKNFNPRVRDALWRLAEIAQDASAVIQHAVAPLAAASVQHVSDREVHVDCRPLSAAEPYLVRELLVDIWEHQHWPLRAMTQEKWNQLVDMIAVESPSQVVLPGKIVARRADLKLILRQEIVTERKEVQHRGTEDTE